MSNLRRLVFRRLAEFASNYSLAAVSAADGAIRLFYLNTHVSGLPVCVTFWPSLTAAQPLVSNFHSATKDFLLAFKHFMGYDAPSILERLRAGVHVITHLT